MSVYNDTLGILKKYNIKADKSLGQNFLISDEVVEKIVEEADIKKEDTVIEIGPGLGALTNLLLEKSDDVKVIELDERMVNILKSRFILSKNLTIIYNDVLKVDLKELTKNAKGKVKVVANLPYYISTPIIMKLLEANDIIDEIIVMVQKEVADRLTAKTGTRLAGAITYEVEYFSNSEEIIKVTKDCFIPSPKVDSAVIKLTLKKNIEKDNVDKLFKIVKAAFSQRRKTLENALLNSGMIESKAQLEKIYNELGFEKNIRGEKLTLEDYINLSKFL